MPQDAAGDRVIGLDRRAGVSRRHSRGKAQCEPAFHTGSYGFRPNRNAHQAIWQAQRNIREGYGWIVDADLETFIERVNHDRLTQRLKQHVPDRQVLRLINRYLKAGVWIGSQTQATTAGVPQGGPFSPVLANIVLDELDLELQKRGLRFARYADDCNIFVRIRRAGERVMASIERFVRDRPKRTVNPRKSAVDRPWKRKFLGFTISATNKVKVAEQAIIKLKAKAKELTRRTRGHRLSDIIAELREILLGWKAYFGIAEILSSLRDIDKWIRRRLRCYQRKQCGRAGYCELRKRGVTVREAWNCSKSAHGPWRISMAPALRLALPNRLFRQMGLPSLAA